MDVSKTNLEKHTKTIETVYWCVGALWEVMVSILEKLVAVTSTPSPFFFTKLRARLKP